VGRLFGWIAGLVGIAALARVLARRSRRTQPAVAPPPSADPAETLRQKLAETRGSTATVEPQAPDTAADRTVTLEERRARVHAKAHEALEAMEATEALEEQSR
jgi:hypothetical protein